MDNRKKSIRDLGEKKREALRSVDGMLENLGDALLSRAPGDEAAEYRRLLGEIGETQTLIQAVEADTARLETLEGDMERKEQEDTANTAALSDLYADLGERLLEDPASAEFSEPYRKQSDLLSPKIKSLEDRLQAIEDKEDANVFTWIGKSAQEMVIRSFLGKSRVNLRRIHAAAGETYLSLDKGEPVTSTAVLHIRGEIDKLRAKNADLNEELTVLREERRRINDSFSPEGSAAKKKQILERHIQQTREQLSQVCLRCGRLAEEGGFEGKWAAPGEDMAALPGRVREKRALIADYDAQIDKLNAALAIDAQKREIERMEKTIGDHRRRISVAETAIAELNSRIVESNRRIQELMKI
jgi:chromosome segregation ATPase